MVSQCFASHRFASMPVREIPVREMPVRERIESLCCIKLYDIKTKLPVQSKKKNVNLDTLCA
jgi:hypothetical protein